MIIMESSRTVTDTGTELSQLANVPIAEKLDINNITFSNNSSNSVNITTTLAPDIVRDDSLRFILIPLSVLTAIFLLSAVVYMMARNRRRLAHAYCKRKLTRNFGQYDDDSDSPLEQGDIDEYDNDDPTECLLKGKLQIDNRYETYQTTPVSATLTANRRELFT